jgi:hypothetical protein
MTDESPLNKPLTSPPLIMDDEWEAPPPSRARIAVIGVCIGIALIVTCVELLRNRERMWEPENEAIWVPLTAVPAALLPDTELRTEPMTPPLPAPKQIPPRAGYLSINSSPWAELSVDGRVVGTTPKVRIRVTPGRHRLLLMREGFQTHSAWITVPAGGTLRLTGITLAKIAP